MPLNHQVIERMASLASQWEAQNDKRAIFLRCYSMMTDNMLSAIEQQRFHDNPWVEHLLHRFADYYFDALACFDCGEEVPLPWREVHQAAGSQKLHVLQHLLLGVNAHINYDLVLTLHEILEQEWESLPETVRRKRYEDHRLVNAIIGETIDKVQDEVVENYAPEMDFIDKAMGRLDELLLTKLISRWRENVWENAIEMLECRDEKQKARFLQELERKVLNNAAWLELKGPFKR